MILSSTTKGWVFEHQHAPRIDVQNRPVFKKRRGVRRRSTHTHPPDQIHGAHGRARNGGQNRERREDGVAWVIGASDEAEDMQIGVGDLREDGEDDVGRDEHARSGGGRTAVRVAGEDGDPVLLEG